MDHSSEPDADPQPTGEDPLIDEVREIRRKLSERFDNDPVRLCEHARRVSEAYRDGGVDAAVEAANASSSSSSAVTPKPK